MEHNSAPPNTYTYTTIPVGPLGTRGRKCFLGTCVWSQAVLGLVDPQLSLSSSPKPGIARGTGTVMPILWMTQSRLEEVKRLTHSFSIVSGRFLFSVAT